MAKNSIALRNGNSASGLDRLARQRVERQRARGTSLLERHELLARCARARRCRSSVSRRLGCLISAVRASSVSTIAVGVDQLGRGLDADAGDARHVVDGVAAERLHVDHLVGRDAEFVEHLVGADPAQRRLAGARDGVEHADRAIGLDQLHQVLVGRDDGDLAARGRAPARHRWR